MKAAERRSRLLELLTRVGVARPADLAHELGVSGETIRRDVMKLEAAGEVVRVHGAVAHVRDGLVREPGRSERSLLHGAAKRRIGALVATLIEPRDTVILDVGTTVEQCAASLRPDFGGRVISNSIPAICRLTGRNLAGVDLLGGQVRLDELSSAGPQAIAALAGFHADVAVLGSGGIHADAGLTDYHADEVALRQIMLAAASRSYVVADGSKIGRVALRFVCPLADVTAVITDASADPDQVAALRDAGVRVLLATDTGADNDTGTDNADTTTAGGSDAA